MATLTKNRGYRVCDSSHEMVVYESNRTGLSLNKTVEQLIKEAYIARRLENMSMSK